MCSKTVIRLIMLWYESIALCTYQPIPQQSSQVINWPIMRQTLQTGTSEYWTNKLLTGFQYDLMKCKSVFGSIHVMSTATAVRKRNTAPSQTITTTPPPPPPLPTSSISLRPSSVGGRVSIEWTFDWWKCIEQLTLAHGTICFHSKTENMNCTPFNWCRQCSIQQTPLAICIETHQSTT